MLVMRTIEDTTNPLGELVSAQRIIAVGLDHFSLALEDNPQLPSCLGMH
jgi:hypothetical protein